MGERIRQVRCALRLSKVRFALEMNLSRQTVYAYESGEQMPMVPALHRLRSHLNVDLNWLVTGEGASPFARLGLASEIPSHNGDVLNEIET